MHLILITTAVACQNKFLYLDLSLSEMYPMTFENYIA